MLVRCMSPMREPWVCSLAPQRERREERPAKGVGLCLRSRGLRAAGSISHKAPSVHFLLQTDDSNGDLDPGVLLTAQTITSETTSSTTTTQITKVMHELDLPSGLQ